MALFTYVARDRENKQKKGKITARTQREAYGKLREQQLRVINIAEIPETIWVKDLNFDGKLKMKDFVIYLRQFSTLLKAGITIVDATNILSRQTDSKVLKKALAEIEELLREGIPLSEAYERYPKLFKPLFISMIRAGEATGTIDDSLVTLADYYQKQYRTRKKVQSAMTYPIMLVVLMTGVLALMLLFVVPTFVQLFNDSGIALPGITLFVLNASDFLQTFWWLILLIILAIVVAVSMMRKTEKGRYFFDHLSLRIPLFGKLLQKSAIARVTLTLSSLFASSVPALRAVDIAENVIENAVIEKILREGRNSMERGDSLAAPMREHWVIPPLVTQMILIGEQTGSLDGMLAEIASFYEVEVETTTDQLKALIEPLMILVLAVVAGFLILAIMLPMFEMFGTIQ